MKSQNDITGLLKRELLKRYSHWRWKTYRKFKKKNNWEIASKIAEYGLFDAHWYLHQNPDVAALGVDPFVHYVEYGYKQLRNPHWLFDVKYCLEKYPEIKGEDPILTIVSRGGNKRCSRILCLMFIGI